MLQCYQQTSFRSAQFKQAIFINSKRSITTFPQFPSCPSQQYQILSTSMIAEEQALRKRPNIIVTGTPGTGKTTFCQLLNQSLSFHYLPIGQMVREHKLYSSWNEQFDVPEFDQEKLIQFIEQNYDVANGGLLIDFHSPDVFPHNFIDLVILMRCENQTLYKRLEARGYKQEKITENIECQIFEQVKHDIQEYFPRQDMVLELRNQKQEDMQKNLQMALNWLMAYKQKMEQMNSQQ